MRGHSFVRLFKRDSREPLRYFAVVAVVIIVVLVVLVVLIFLIALVILVVLVINICSCYCWESKQ